MVCGLYIVKWILVGESVPVYREFLIMKRFAVKRDLCE